MSDKRMLILPAEVVKKVDENRGDFSQAEFIDYLIEERLGGRAGEVKEIPSAEFEALKKDVKQLLTKEAAEKGKFATKEEIQIFQEDTKKLIKSFLDFFIGYGLELGKQPGGDELKELAKKLDSLEGGLPAEENGGEVKIKWK